MRRIGRISLIIVMIMSMIAGCGNTQATDSTTDEIADNTDKYTPKEAHEDKEKAEEEYANSTPDNDTDIGLQSVTVDSANANLTDEQRELVGVFDDDYLFFDKELFQRYPDYFQGCQVKDAIIVKKIVSSDNGEFVFVASESDQHNSWADTESYYMYVKCQLLDTRYVEGDYVAIYGRFTGTEVIEIDGKTYSLPVVEAYPKSYLEYENHSYGGVAVYPYDDVKRFVKTIFGNDVIVDEYRTSDMEDRSTPAELYKITFENQSNANFSECYLWASRFGFGFDGEDVNGNPYNLIVGSDFQHFYYIGTYASTKTTKLAYYDKDFKKIWEREFEDTENAAYDYTKNNIYLALNNNLYIINAVTGEDTFDSIYVGKQSAVRKTSDGIYLIKGTDNNDTIRADVVIKYDITGKLLWTASLESDFSRCEDIQFVNNNLFFEYYGTDYADTIAVIDTETGELVNTCKTINSYSEAPDTENTYSAEDTSSSEQYQGSDYYILPDADSRYYDRAELSQFTKDDLRLARNEIYARHGRTFDSQDLQTYFDSMPWYVPVYSPAEFDAMQEQVLNQYEKANRDLIADIE